VIGSINPPRFLMLATKLSNRCPRMSGKSADSGWNFTAAPAPEVRRATFPGIYCGVRLWLYV
jgi:hypothetical protein